ncbi:prepilin peptidase [Paraburkholderia sp. MMS20-SJTR3]|uniref:Prepilin peptidase n=1 Tax=Paraburkholderia sejongensis TaxID=2886946 RepID=A0ABS8JMQ0_9BURK|nr:prepilin peptidase [Paraburkholderia sp. MMS20-SJTR3]MCC8391166.1 prepilin peptidase [Paraburkholderia sp. MMS20-SJTR3]
MSVLLGTVLFIAWAAVVAISDCRARRIPNSIVIAGLAAAFGCALFAGNPFHTTFIQSATGAVVGLLVLLPFFAFGLMGAADVKVFAVLGAWCGMHALLGLWMAASLAAGVHALWLLIVTRTRLMSLGRAGAGARVGATFELAGRAATPYGACLTVAATLWLVLQTAGGRM